jgi:hypothetical protein
MQNSDPDGRDVLGLVAGSGESARSRGPAWPAADASPSLTRRIADLETRIRALEAELDAEHRQRLERAESTPSMQDVLADMQGTVAAIRVEQRKFADEIASLRRGALDAVLPIAAVEVARPDAPRSTIADAKNGLKDALLDEIFARATAPAEAVSVPIQTAPPQPVQIAEIVAPVLVEHRPAAGAGLRQIQVVISSIHSFPRLLEVEQRIRTLPTVSAFQLRDFRNGIATFAVSVGEAISPAEFGTAVQMLDSLRLRLEGATPTTAELRAEEEPPAS